MTLETLIGHTSLVIHGDGLTELFIYVLVCFNYHEEEHPEKAVCNGG